MLKSGTAIFTMEFQYLCVLEICDVNISNGISVLLSAGNMSSAYFLHRYSCFFHDFDVCELKNLSFMKVFVACHGC